MITGKTLWTFLLSLLLGSGIVLWNAWHPDGCYRYLHGEPHEASTQIVEMSGQSVAIPCEQWYPRQTMYVQGACVAEGTVLAAFLVRALGDFINWRRVKSGQRRLQE